MDWNQLADRILAGEEISRREALAVLQSTDEELLAVLGAAHRVRHHHRGRQVQLQLLHNGKSGLCTEDCAFCSQSALHRSPVARYPLHSVEQMVEGAQRSVQLGAATYCIVTSSRGPSARELDQVCEAVRCLKRENPALQVCTSLGMLCAEQAEKLAAAGVDRYNHNLETSREFFAKIVTTHRYEDRLETLQRARVAGLQICCGGILGLGEELLDRVDLAFAIREQNAQAIPVNFLDPRPETPLADRTTLSPLEGLRALAMFRLVNPDRDLRAAGGREACLRSLQPLALLVVNSIFVNGYLTTDGQGYDADLGMIRDLGLEPTLAEG